MMKSNMQIQNNYSTTTKWEKLYLLKDDWKSDMEFYNDEKQLLSNLMDNNFIWLIRDENIEQAQKKLPIHLIDIKKLLTK